MASRKRGAPLTAAFVRTVSDPGRYGDGRGGFGLSLLVRKTRNGRTSRMWCQRIMDPLTGKQTSIGLGSYPRVTLAEARAKALHNRRQIDAGRDPRGGGIPTFERATEAVIRLHKAGWKPGSRTESQWRASFATHLYPALGKKRIDQIKTADLLNVLRTLVHESPAMSKKLRARIAKVFEWAVAHGYRPDNPAGAALVSVLPNGKTTTHHKALPHGEVAGALAKVGGSAAGLATRFLALTATRTIEPRLATWSEIDLEAKVWTIPADRMKAGREHRVPLSEAALAVLAEARERWGSEGPVFPGRGGGPLGETTIGALFRRRKIGAPPHGLRSSFRDWCGESGVAREVAEACLAHVVKGVEGAYARSDLLERRREVMERWGEYVT